MPVKRLPAASRANVIQNGLSYHPLRGSNRNSADASGEAMRNIIDTGPLVYRFDDTDNATARWSRRLFSTHAPPFFTYEAVLTEAAYMTSPELIARMVKDGDLVVDFPLQDEVEAIHSLVVRYPKMDWADACLVRMSELTPECRIFTIDRRDFSIYRRFRNKVIPAVFPD
jgi:hypothetical protein